MEPMRVAGVTPAAVRVGERQGGGQRQADAFRRALQEGAEDAGGERPSDQRADQPATARDARTPLRSALQPTQPIGRKDGDSRQVDVIA